MAKSKRNIIIIVSAIVLLIAGIIVLNIADFSSNEAETTATTEPVYTVFSTEVSDLLSVEVRTADGRIQANNNPDSGWGLSGLDNSDVDSSKVYTLVSTVSSITSKNKIEENVTGFAQYGLENPSIVVKMKDRKYGEVTLYIGDKSPTLGEYFIRLNDDTTVYTLYSYKVDTIMQPLAYYSDFNRFNINIDDVTAIKIERDNETIELKIADDIENTTNNVWELVRPYQSSANDEYIDNNILAPLSELTFNTPVEGERGTDSPTAKITLTVKPYDTDTGKYGEEYTEAFAIGKIENGKANVSYNGRVYEVNEEAVKFAETSAFNILNKLQALVDISDVSAFTVTAGGKSSTTEITRSGDDMEFKLDGKDVDAKTARQMYQAMISLAVDGEYKGETLGDTVLTLDFKTLSDDGVTIEVKSINELSCALVRNGKAEFTIKKSKLEEFIKLWEAYIKETTGGEE